MIKRQTIITILTTTALAYSIATPAQAASLIDGLRLEVAACDSEKPATATPDGRKDKPAQT